MGAVIRFPLEDRIADGRRSFIVDEPASVIILPVVRIERHVEQPVDDQAPRKAKSPRRRRRRASQS
jgi:hypothetical protein